MTAVGWRKLNFLLKRFETQLRQGCSTTGSSTLTFLPLFVTFGFHMKGITISLSTEREALLKTMATEYTPSPPWIITTIMKKTVNGFFVCLSYTCTMVLFRRTECGGVRGSVHRERGVEKSVYVCARERETGVEKSERDRDCVWLLQSRQW